MKTKTGLKAGSRWAHTCPSNIPSGTPCLYGTQRGKCRSDARGNNDYASFQFGTWGEREPSNMYCEVN